MLFIAAVYLWVFFSAYAMLKRASQKRVTREGLFPRLWVRLCHVGHCNWGAGPFLGPLAGKYCQCILTHPWVNLEMYFLTYACLFAHTLSTSFFFIFSDLSLSNMLSFHWTGYRLRERPVHSYIFAGLLFESGFTSMPGSFIVHCSCPLCLKCHCSLWESAKAFQTVSLRLSSPQYTWLSYSGF